MPARSLRLGELVGLLALAQDNAFGQPLESQLRSCVLAGWLAEAAGGDDALRATAYWVALLRYVGCTGHAHEVAALFGDDIAILGQTLVHDAGDPAEVVRDIVTYATAPYPPDQREAVAEETLRGLHDWAVMNFRSGCEASDQITGRLGMDDRVREALGHTFERWNGTGPVHGSSGEQIPLAMRIVHLTHDAEAIARRFSPERALEAVRERRDRTYDPGLADLFLGQGEEWLQRLAKLDPWDAVLAAEPEPRRVLAGAELDELLLVVADFVDVKSPYAVGHSRRCAELAEAAGRDLGLDDAELVDLRHAALVHELGMTAVSNAVLEKAEALTRAERDGLEVHPLRTEQMLRRTTGLASLAAIASGHHERGDGSGYHKGVPLRALPRGAGLLSTAEVYVGMTTDRADRPAMSASAAAAEVRRLVAEGELDGEAAEAVLGAVGHEKRRTASAGNPAGLSDREIEVLRLAARGLTAKQIGETLFLSPKTVDHHIQHVYTKIGVSTRAAATLWGVQNGLVG